MNRFAEERLRVPMRRVLLCFSILLAGCSSVSLSDLPGEYLADWGFAQEQLELFADGKYRQIITISGKQEKTVHDGTWTYSQRYSDVFLDHPILVTDLAGRFNSDYQTPVAGSWILTPSRWLGKLSLNWDDDSGVRFDKVR